MPQIRIQRVQFICQRCDYEWFPRGKPGSRQGKPKRCPSCKSLAWDRDDYRPKLRGRHAKKKAEEGLPLVEVLKGEDAAELTLDKPVANFATVEKPLHLKRTVENGRIVEPIVTPYVPEEERA